MTNIENIQGDIKNLIEYFSIESVKENASKGVVDGTYLMTFEGIQKNISELDSQSCNINNLKSKVTAAKAAYTDQHDTVKAIQELTAAMNILPMKQGHEGGAPRSEVPGGPTAEASKKVDASTSKAPIVNYFLSSHLFENRLYISPTSKDDISKAVHEDGHELKGAGIRCYSKPIGWLLSLIGISSKINVGDETFYINNRSFSQFIIRSTELVKPTSLGDAARKLDKIYIEHQKKGYNERKVELVNTALKRILSKNEIKDLRGIVGHLEQVAIHEGKARH